MNGVEILNEIPIYNIAEWASVTTAVILIATPLAFFIYSIINWEGFGCLVLNTVCGFFAGLVIIVLFIVFTSETNIAYDKNSVQYYQYQVVVSDEVKFSEFMEKYEILEQNGNIYTIQERN